MVTYSEVSLPSILRSVRITGILACLYSISTGSQPDSTTGENAITSTFCAIYERIALIWFSCFCWASENFRLMPASLAALLTETVLAVRHALSAPTCEKPRVILVSSAWAVRFAPSNSAEPSSAPMAARRACLMFVSDCCVCVRYCRAYLFSRGRVIQAYRNEAYRRGSWRSNQLFGVCNTRIGIAKRGCRIAPVG